MRIASLVIPLCAASACAGPSVVPTPLPSGDRSDCRRTLVLEGAGPNLDVQFLVPGDGTSDREHLDRWCDGVGASLAHASSAAEHVAGFDSLMVITWNNGVGSGDLTGFISWVRELLTARGWSQDQFVLLLQEVYSDRNTAPLQPPDRARHADRIGEARSRSARSEVSRAAAAHGLSLFYAPSMRNGAGDGFRSEDRGNAIMTPLQISSPVAVELPFEAQRRVAQTVVVRHETSSGAPWCFRLANVHLDLRSGRWGPVLGLGNPWGKVRQLQGLLAVLPEGPNTILGGDLNSHFWGGRSESEPAVDELGDRFTRGTPHQEAITTVHHFVLGFALDHLAFDLPGTWTVGPIVAAPDPWGSDHTPLLSWIAIPEQGGCARPGQGP